MYREVSLIRKNNKIIRSNSIVIVLHRASSTKLSPPSDPTKAMSMSKGNTEELRSGLSLHSSKYIIPTPVVTTTLCHCSTPYVMPAQARAVSPSKASSQSARQETAVVHRCLRGRNRICLLWDKRCGVESLHGSNQDCSTCHERKLCRSEWVISIKEKEFGLIIEMLFRCRK